MGLLVRGLRRAATQEGCPRMPSCYCQDRFTSNTGFSQMGADKSHRQVLHKEHTA